MNTLIDPKAITNFSRTQEELELFALFCCVVAGKNSKIQARKLDEFLHGSSPFMFVRALINMDCLRVHMEHVKLGQYNRLEQVFIKLVQTPIRWASLEELEAIMGLKTSRFFLVHSRPNVRAAILDTHILKWMGEQGYDVPKATPTNKKAYQCLEAKFLYECDKRGVSVAEMDLKVWTERSQTS